MEPPVLRLAVFLSTELIQMGWIQEGRAEPVNPSWLVLIPHRSGMKFC